MARAAAGAAAVVTLALWLSLARGDPALYPAREAGVRVVVLDHGWDSGLVFGRPQLRGAALRIARHDRDAAERLRWLTARVPAAEWIEIGWGDADFYRATPAIGDVDPSLGLGALLWPAPSVLQVVSGAGPVAGAGAFPRWQAL